VNCKVSDYRTIVPRGHVDFKAVPRDDCVFPHQLIRHYCPAIIKLRRRRSDEVHTTSRIAIGDFKAIVKPFLALLLRDFTCSGRPTVPRRDGNDYELTGVIIGRRLRPISNSACAMGRDAMQLVDHAHG